MSKFLDQFGSPVRSGRHYAVGPSRSRGVLCVVYDDPETGELMLRRKAGDPYPQRIYGEDMEYSLSRQTVFTLVDASGCEITDANYFDDEDQAYIKERLLAARHHKDQLDGIEQALITRLHADRDSDLIDTISGCVHGDEPPERLFALLEA